MFWVIMSLLAILGAIRAWYRFWELIDWYKEWFSNW